MISDVSKFISKLDKLNNTKFEVFVPSLNKKVETKALNLKQQKDLIAPALDGIRGTLNFSKTLNNVIIDNSGLNDLKIYDRLPFTIQLRKEALGNKIQTNDGEVELHKILNNIKENSFNIAPEQTVRHENLTIHLKVPTLQQENILLTNCIQTISTLDDDLTEHVGILYLVEIVKYIDSLKIDDEVVDMSEIKIEERIKLVERLPLAIYRDISEFIATVNKYENDILTVGGVLITIDSLFFDSSSDE
tara:strand:+ start:1572 stop:2312 length:741 start_codon:yes stop_codon:yes gene_type:complete